MASLDWQDRRRIELASHRGDDLDDPVHAALAVERGRQFSAPLYWALLIAAPVAAYLLWSWSATGGVMRLWAGAVAALVAVVLLTRIVVYRRARARHLAIADFDDARAVALAHRTTYRRRY